MAFFTDSMFSSSFPCLLILLSYAILTLIAKPISTSALQSTTTTLNFDSEIALYGDAKLEGSDGGASVKLTSRSVPSWGLLLRRKPFRLLDPSRLRNPTSFSTDLAFSISPGDGGGVSLVLVPADFGSKLSSQGSPSVSGEKRFAVAFVNVSSTDLGRRNGQKLKSWIDYDASSKRLEVRLAKFRASRPYDPAIAYAMDLSSMWGDEEVLVGISSPSSTENSSRIITVYSWNFRFRNFPNSMHSLPAEPRVSRQDPSDHQKRRVCPLAVIGGLIFATVCGALMAFAVLFLWAVVAANKHMFFPDDHSHVKSMGFRYEKIGVVVEKDNGDRVKN